MTYLLDTCALSEFTKPKPSASVDAWFSQVPDGADFVSVLTLGELEKGITKLATSRRRSSLESGSATCGLDSVDGFFRSTSRSRWSGGGSPRGASWPATR